MEFSHFKSLLLNAESNGTLVTQKHDPNQLSTFTLTPFRSVVSHRLASHLRNFINSEQYSVTEYQNQKFPLLPFYYTITPKPGSEFSIPASGVTGNVPTTQFDTLVVVSGGSAGIHMYGEASANISSKELTGDLTNKRQIK